MGLEPSCDRGSRVSFCKDLMRVIGYCPVWKLNPNASRIGTCVSHTFFLFWIASLSLAMTGQTFAEAAQTGAENGNRRTDRE